MIDHKKLAPLAAGISIVTILCGAGVAWGVSSQKAAYDEDRLTKVEDRQASDHDLLIEVRDDIRWIVGRLKP